MRTSTEVLDWFSRLFHWNWEWTIYIRYLEEITFATLIKDFHGFRNTLSWLPSNLIAAKNSSRALVLSLFFSLSSSVSSSVKTKKNLGQFCECYRGCTEGYSWRVLSRLRRRVLMASVIAVAPKGTHGECYRGCTEGYSWRVLSRLHRRLRKIVSFSDKEFSEVNPPISKPFNCIYRFCFQ